MRKKRLVLLGGGHAHLMTLAHLNRFTDNGFEVVVVQPSPYHYYSGMGAGMLGSTYEPDQIRFNTRKQVESRGGTFIEDAAVHIDPVRQSVNLADNTDVSYDVLSCNTGSHVTSDPYTPSDGVIPAKPISGLIQARKTLRNLLENPSVHVGIIGGGPSAVELACNVRHLAEQHHADRTKHTGHVHISVFAGNQVFYGKSVKLQRIVKRYLLKRSVTVIEDCYVEAVKGRTITTGQGESFPCDLIFAATGVSPSTLFEQSGLTAGDGKGLAVNEYLQSVTYQNIFGGGDCIDYVDRPLDKVGVYAVRQNPVLLHNLLASLKGEPLKKFSPGGDYLLIYNLGGREAVFVKKPLMFSGALAFRIKDYIDRRFMRMYQC